MRHLLYYKTSHILRYSQRIIYLVLSTFLARHTSSAEKKTRMRPSNTSTELLVIFDCDGVLINSEVLASKAEAIALRQAGFDKLSELEIVERFSGTTSKNMVAAIERDYRVKINHSLYAIELRKHLFSIYSRELTQIPGVRDSIEAIKSVRSSSVCVASNSDYDRVKYSLRCVDLESLFNGNVFTSNMVKRPKPAPDLFLFAAREMKVNPQRAVVVEDSVTGVKAAVTAGMTVVGFVGGSHCSDGTARQLLAAGAKEIISQMEDLVPALNRVGLLPPSQEPQFLLHHAGCRSHA